MPMILLNIIKYWYPSCGFTVTQLNIERVWVKMYLNKDRDLNSDSGTLI